MRSTYILYLAMFCDRVRWHALHAMARVLYVVLVAGSAVVGFVFGAVTSLVVLAVALFALVATVVGLLRLMGAYRDPFHMLLDVAILGVAGLAVLLSVPMCLALRALTRR